MAILAYGVYPATDTAQTQPWTMVQESWEGVYLDAYIVILASTYVPMFFSDGTLTYVVSTALSNGQRYRHARYKKHTPVLSSVPIKR